MFLTWFLSALAAKYTLTINFSCPVVFKQSEFAPCLWIVVLDTMPFEKHVSSIAVILEGGYLCLIESLRAFKLCRISLSINRPGSCCPAVCFVRTIQ